MPKQTGPVKSQKTFFFTGNVVLEPTLAEIITKRVHLDPRVAKLDKKIEELTETVNAGVEFREDIKEAQTQLKKIVKERDSLIQTLTPEIEKSFLLELAHLSSSLPEKILRASPDGPHTGTYQKLNKHVHNLASLYSGDQSILLRARIFGKNMNHASKLSDKNLAKLREWLPYQLEVEYWIMKNLLPSLFQDIITRARQDVYAFIDKYALEPPSLYPNKVSVTLYPPMLHCFLQSTTDYVGGFRRGYETIMAIAEPDRTEATVQTLYGILVHELVHAITYRYLEIYSEEDIEGRAFFMPKPVGEALTEILAHFIMTESLSEQGLAGAYFKKPGSVCYQEPIHLLFKFLSEVPSLKENGVGIVQFVRAMFSEARASQLESFLNKIGSPLNRVANPQTSEPIARAGGRKALETLVGALRDPESGLSAPEDSLIF